ncbi:MAG TPA: type II toxin-antitoxin system VapB family antitoxin [Oscillatoriales cyanobacterium M59_W2019_021]|nr:MAG: type II toxin-antitoxin system VapB family antitoxin [Cyanobacteria bacterium J055]HIK32586.1 type II toxin-antitoxin system VapB family antitoxin [Oscillatoriales cyanobacterium M4454_W2019_049]HIK53384.1 type II toxin-antitoxin system VapB family antitoxin [Oscillatoriales cyanobacterium M59_W2019_021]
MINNFVIDETLIQEALALEDHPSIEAMLEKALREYIQRRKCLKILELFGTVDYDEIYDYKAQRNVL